MKVQFEHRQEGRFSELYGPYTFVQLTYSTLRVGAEGEIELATFMNGMWQTEDGKQWSDVNII